jgi:hypothetical protein
LSASLPSRSRYRSTLGSTERSVNSALRRARPALSEGLPQRDRDRASLPASDRLPRRPPVPADPDPGQRPAGIRLLRLGCYVMDGRCSVAHAHGIMVLTLTADGISMLTRFTDTSVMPAFGFPRTFLAESAHRRWLCPAGPQARRPRSSWECRTNRVQEYSRWYVARRKVAPRKSVSIDIPQDHRFAATIFSCWRTGRGLRCAPPAGLLRRGLR